MDFKGMLVSVGFSMAKIPIPPLMLLGKMTGVSNRLLLSWSAYALAARQYCYPAGDMA